MADINADAIVQEQAPIQTPENDDQKPIYNKHQVSDVVRREREKAIEQTRREMLTSQRAPEQQASSLGGINQLSSDQIRQMIADEASKHISNQVQMATRNKLASEFAQKVKAADSKYPGLEANVSELDFQSLAPLIPMINSLDAGEIMKDLLDHPMKMGNLVALAHSQPRLAEKALHELHNSIKANQAAIAQDKQTQDPLNPIKPSIATMDNGDLSVTDFRKMFKG